MADHDRAAEIVITLARRAGTALQRREAAQAAQANGIEDTVRRSVLRFGYVVLDEEQTDANHSS